MPDLYRRRKIGSFAPTFSKIKKSDFHPTICLRKKYWIMCANTSLIKNRSDVIQQWDLSCCVVTTQLLIEKIGSCAPKDTATTNRYVGQIFSAIIIGSCALKKFDKKCDVYSDVFWA